MTGTKKVELLAPAGSFDAMRAAINAGADAVYMGGTRFGARAYADNPDEEGMIKAIEYCHLRGRKLYMTVNTLLKERELYDCLFEFIEPLYRAGLDAVIVQDTGVMRYITEKFPGLPIHVSTQATLTASDGVNELIDRGYGITRVVPARELSLEELKKLREGTDVELEVFIHGALCFCYSGQCLLSSMAGGRSGNRGRCAQPCRRMYRASMENANGESEKSRECSGYFLSPKDMCALPYINAMIEAGIDSFKIEGRMKNPEYCAGVVSVYREFIDEYYSLGSDAYRQKYESPTGQRYMEQKMDFLRELYNRGGFNNGYLFSRNGQDMMSMKRPNHSGVEVGFVTGISGRRADFVLTSAIGKGDVLEIRSENGKGVFEYTVGDAAEKGRTVSVITMKDRPAAKGMTVFRTKNASEISELREKYIERDTKVRVDIVFTARKGSSSCLEIRAAETTGTTANGGKTAVVYGNVTEQAQNAPMTAEKIEKQLAKLGETDFESGEITVNIDDDIFIPVGELNRLRREAVEKLAEGIISAWKRPGDDITGEAGDKSEDTADINGQDATANPGENAMSRIYGNDDMSHSEKSDSYVFVATVRTVSQLYEVLKNDSVSEVYYNISSFSEKEADEAVRLVRDANAGKADGKNVRLRFGLPFICRSNMAERLISFCTKYRDYGFVARNYESIAVLKKLGADYRTDYNIYAMNSAAASETGTGYAFPQEITLKEIAETGYKGSSGEIVVYGLLPVMISAQCLNKNAFGICKMNSEEAAEAEKQSDPVKKQSAGAEKLSARAEKMAAGEKLSAGAEKLSVRAEKMAVGEKLSAEAEKNRSEASDLCRVIRLTDEKGFMFTAVQECAFCYNIIYNSAVTNILDKPAAVMNTGVRRFRADFTMETPSEVKLVMDNFTSVFQNDRYTMPTEIMNLKYTNGHYFNGAM